MKTGGVRSPAEGQKPQMLKEKRRKETDTKWRRGRRGNSTAARVSGEA